jgi:hypothetical protein
MGCWAQHVNKKKNYYYDYLVLHFIWTLRHCLIKIKISKNCYVWKTNYELLRVTLDGLYFIISTDTYLWSIFQQSLTCPAVMMVQWLSPSNRKSNFTRPSCCSSHLGRSQRDERVTASNVTVFTPSIMKFHQIVQTLLREQIQGWCRKSVPL